MNDLPPEFDQSLVAETLGFLRGTKTSEAMSDALRESLYVRRRLDRNLYLENVVANALAEGRSVLVAGSAGGGKTMLLNAIAGALRDAGVQLASLEEKPEVGSSRVVIVPDLTAVEGDRELKLRRAEKIGPILLAANEGVLHETNLPRDLANSLQTLRLLQSGRAVQNPDEAVVIDLAGLDPVSGALTELLRHPLLHAAVQANEHECDPSSCPRLLALSQLREGRVADVLADLVHSAVGPGELLFRDVWDFITDIFLGGECDEALPTSVWFWRCFYGTSLVAQQLRQALRPEYLSLPSVSPFLYWGHWEQVDEIVGRQPAFVLPGIEPERAPDRRLSTQLMRWLRIQAALLLRAGNVAAEPYFIGELASALERQVSRDNRVGPLIQAMNAYFVRKKPSEMSPTLLDLWVEMSMERATDRPSSLVSLGQVSSTRLTVKRSRVVANLPELQDLYGSRLYLTSADSTGSGKEPLLVLDMRLFKALSRGRPVATSDRTGDDADYAIRQFIFDVASTLQLEDPSRIAIISRDRLATATESAWRIDVDQLRVRGLS